jgi:hypothetical protein
MDGVLEGDAASADWAHAHFILEDDSRLVLTVDVDKEFGAVWNLSDAADLQVIRGAGRDIVVVGRLSLYYGVGVLHKHRELPRAEVRVGAGP